MSVENDLHELSEVVQDQVAHGIARDLAIKLLAGLVSQAVDKDAYATIVRGHIQAIQRLEADGEGDTEMNEKIAAHFEDLLLEPSDEETGPEA